MASNVDRKHDPSFVPKLARKARLRFDRHSGKHLLVYPERGLALNESAAEIIRRCDGTRTLAQIVEELARETSDASARDVEEHVVELVETLAEKGLLEP